MSVSEKVVQSGVEWSRPRTTPMAGRRKATSRFCKSCEQWHKTDMNPNPEYCADLEQERQSQKNQLSEFPWIRQSPR